MTIPEIPPEGFPLPGDERYVLRKLLGRGGFGDAYLADDQELARKVVIKLLMNLSDPSIRDRFKREARISANIRHPAVVQVFDIGSLPDGRPFFVMEAIDGISLTQFVNERGRTFSLSRALTLIAEAAEGLAAAHKMGVIHRDIKPDNILVTRGDGGHAKLIDFGIAKKAVEEAGAQPTSKQTSVGTVLGTPRYISPEQATAKVLAAASDLYSLGCVMYTLLTGRSPFDGTQQELMMHHVYTPAPPLSASAPDRAFPPEVEGIVARLLAKDPLRRYQSGEELAHALRRSAAQAKAAEEADATSALSSITEENHPQGAPTVSNLQSAPRPAVPASPGAAIGLSEGAATAGFPVASPIAEQDESLSLRMPVAVMEGNLTGTTQAMRPGRTLGVVFAALLLVLMGAGVTGIVLRSQPPAMSSASQGPAPSSPPSPSDENKSTAATIATANPPPTQHAEPEATNTAAPAATLKPGSTGATKPAAMTTKPTTITGKPTIAVAPPGPSSVSKPPAMPTPPPVSSGVLDDDRL